MRRIGEGAEGVSESGQFLTVCLKDVILALQICSGVPLSVPVYTEADVNRDGRLGLPEAVYGLRVIASTLK